MAQCAFSLVCQAISAVAPFELFLALAVFLCVHFSIAYHPVYLLLGQAAGGSNGDLLLASRGLITGRDIENTIGINVEGYLNLRNTSRGRSNPFELEVTQALVIAGQLAFALQHVDINCGLVIFSRAKDLALASWNSRIPLNHPVNHPPHRLTPRAERTNFK